MMHKLIVTPREFKLDRPNDFLYDDGEALHVMTTSREKVQLTTIYKGPGVDVHNIGASLDSLENFPEQNMARLLKLAEQEGISIISWTVYVDDDTKFNSTWISKLLPFINRVTVLGNPGENFYDYPDRINGFGRQTRIYDANGDSVVTEFNRVTEWIPPYKREKRNAKAKKEPQGLDGETY